MFWRSAGHVCVHRELSHFDICHLLPASIVNNWTMPSSASALCRCWRVLHCLNSELLADVNDSCVGQTENQRDRRLLPMRFSGPWSLDGIVSTCRTTGSEVSPGLPGNVWCLANTSRCLQWCFLMKHSPPRHPPCCCCPCPPSPLLSIVRRLPLCFTCTLSTRFCFARLVETAPFNVEEEVEDVWSL